MDIRAAVAEELKKSISLVYPDAEIPFNIEDVLEIPPDTAMGDLAFPTFRLSKVLRAAPPQIAQKLASVLNKPDLFRVETAGGYLNFFFNRINFAQSTLNAILSDPEHWGSSTQGSGKTVCMDYSSVNIAKRFHIGHLSTTVIGNSLMRIYRFLGWNTVGINHLGDWGTQFGNLIVAYKLWGSQELLDKDGIGALTELYQRFHREAEKQPELFDEGRKWFKAIESGDPEALTLFNLFKKITLRDVQKIYDILDVHFDSYAGESFYADKMPRVINELEQKGLLVDSDGAKIVNLDAWDMPPCLILKSDGASLYPTRDIAAALYRKETYHFDLCLYIVAYQQNLHFRQWFKVLELMGYPWAATQLQHVAFGMVSYEGETLSTREGHMVFLEDVLDKAQEKALSIIEQKSPDLKNKKEVARQVGVGAVVFSALQNGRIKDLDFWWDRALNFDGDTGPYVQYTHARCCSVLRKAESLEHAQADYEALASDEAQGVIKLLSRFPDAVKDACAKNEPYLVTRAVTDIAKAYNQMYYVQRVLDDDPSKREAMLQLTQAVKSVIRTGLYLIGVEAPERM